MFKDNAWHERHQPGLLSNLRFRVKIVLGFLVLLGLSAVGMSITYFGF
ncbi:hypothetical protein [Bradyrhizobium yuanmingense]|nr:hypothetical protein [Bradyrhizobium yuanmingense]MDF0584947.1 hypothetical protein [Bradyrhizobium yuanmingense]